MVMAMTGSARLREIFDKRWRMNEIGLSPTSLHCPVVEYIDACAKAGFDGLGLRLFESPGLNYAGWDPVIGDQPVMREIKTAMASTGLVLYDILSYYLQADMDIDGMKASLEFGAELKAKWALVIGDDPDWIAPFSLRAYLAYWLTRPATSASWRS